jgi:hypothetical protein
MRECWQKIDSRKQLMRCTSGDGVEEDHTNKSALGQATRPYKVIVDRWKRDVGPPEDLNLEQRNLLEFALSDRVNTYMENVNKSVSKAVVECVQRSGSPGLNEKIRWQSSVYKGVSGAKRLYEM